MIQGLVEKLVTKYLRGIFVEVDKKNMQVGAWKGDLKIDNLELRPDIFANHDLPFTLISSYVNCITIKVPWAKLSTKSVEVSVSKMHVEVGLLDEDQWNFADFLDVDNKFNALKAHAESFLEVVSSNIKEIAHQDKKSGYLKRLSLRIIDNLALSLEDIDFTIRMQSGNSFGCTLKGLKVETVDETFADPVYLNRFSKRKREGSHYKLADIKNFTLFWNYADTAPKDDYIEERKAVTLIVNEQRRTMMSFDGCAKIVLTDEDQIDLVSGRTNFVFEIQKLDINVGLDQIEDIVQLLGLLKKYSHKNSLNNETVDHTCYRPLKRPSKKNRNIQQWWKYAAKATAHYSFLNDGRYIQL